MLKSTLKTPKNESVTSCEHRKVLEGENVPHILRGNLVFILVVVGVLDRLCCPFACGGRVPRNNGSII